MASPTLDLPCLYPVTEDEIRVLIDETLYPTRKSTMKAAALLVSS
jgi:hypothetical protein